MSGLGTTPPEGPSGVAGETLAPPEGSAGTTATVATAGRGSPRRSGRRWRLALIVGLLAFGVAASASALFRSAPEARWYYAANTGVLLRLQPVPQASATPPRSFSHTETRSDAPVFKVTWYTTRSDYVVPRGTSPSAIVEFYRFQLEPLWTTHTVSQAVVRGGVTVARMPGLQASQGDMFVTVLTAGMVGSDGRQRSNPRYTVQVDYRVM